MPTHLIICKAGPHYSSNWYEMDAAAAEKEHCGILEAGGNVWDTDDGDMPEEAHEEGYEVVSVTDVTGMSSEEILELCEGLKATADVMLS